MLTSNPVPRVAAVHDISGFGRSSLAIVSPILSTMGVQVCPLPTALLSTQTSGFQDYHFHDLTEDMRAIIDHWEKLELRFDAIYSGFLGSVKQIELVLRMIDHLTGESSLVLVDPVLGDDGELYGPLGDEMIEGMRRLIGSADIITPNFTEASLLLGESYTTSIEIPQIKGWLHRLADMGPSCVIVTSVPIKGSENVSSVFAYNRLDQRMWKVEVAYIPAAYPGTGDMFASVIAGSLLQHDSLPMAIDRAIQFIVQAIRATFGHRIPAREGVLLEKVLDSLRHAVPVSTYELVD
jgi:pyridoxine kinase